MALEVFAGSGLVAGGVAWPPMDPLGRFCEPQEHTVCDDKMERVRGKRYKQGGTPDAIVGQLMQLVRLKIRGCW